MPDLPLPTVPLGRTDMAITRVGLGAWAIGGAGWDYGWGAQDDEESIATIHRAVEMGLNWIDTAATYGLGHSEEVVGRAVRALPADVRPYVFTKCGQVPDPARPGATRRVATPESIRAELEDSLRRLGVERIDLYQVHWPPEDGAPVDRYWETMLTLRDEGKVRAVGLSNHTVDQLEAAEAVGHVDTLQPKFSALDRRTAPEIAWCRAHGTGVIAYSPMGSGLLTGAFSHERVAALPDDDWRKHDPRFQGAELDAALALTEELRIIADRYGTTPGAVAIAWVLRWPGVTGAIVGARRPTQIGDWFAAATLELDPVDVDAIASRIDELKVGDGPSRP